MAVKEWFRRLQPVQLYLVLFFTSAFFFVELIANYFTHSLTLLLNAYHMLCNIVALVGCIASLKYANQEKCRGGSNCSSPANSTFAVCEEKGNTKTPAAADVVNAKQACPDRRMKNTFGWARIDILTMLMCCVLLASFCFTLLLEAFQTLVHISHHDQMHAPLCVMFIGISGIILNILCYFVIGGYTFNQSLFLHVTKRGNVLGQKSTVEGEQQLAPTRKSPVTMPKRRWILEISRDVLGCVLVVGASVLVYFLYEECEFRERIDDKCKNGTAQMFDNITGTCYEIKIDYAACPWDISKFIDPIIAIVSSILLFALSYPYLRDSCLILLQTIPNHINIDSLQKELLAAFPGIVNVHDFHVWHLAGTKVISTVHITFLNPKVYASITDQVTAFFMEMGITQVTIQPEFHKPNVDKTDCLIRCRGKLCIQSQCCNSEEFLDEIVTSKLTKELQTNNKSYLKKEIIPASSEVDLRKFTLNKSDSTRSTSCKEAESIGNTKSCKTKSCCEGKKKDKPDDIQKISDNSQSKTVAHDKTAQKS